MVILKNKFISMQKIFPKNLDKANGEILVEFNAFHPSHIAISYLSNFLKDKTNQK